MCVCVDLHSVDLHSVVGIACRHRTSGQEKSNHSNVSESCKTSERIRFCGRFCSVLNVSEFVVGSDCAREILLVKLLLLLDDVITEIGAV